MTSSVSLPFPIYVSSPFQILNQYSNSVKKFPWLIIDFFNILVLKRNGNCDNSDFCMGK